MSAFGQSARHYDSLYADKDYSAEANYIHGLIQAHAPGARSLLDLGCGTGRHAVAFAEKGYTVVGVDRSTEMLGEANRLRAQLPSAELRGRLAFHQSDITQLRIDSRFDVATALFHVASYQTSNDTFLAMLTIAREHLNPGGILLFDCWYGPAVLADPPTVRVKRLENGTRRLIRIAEPDMHVNENLVDVNYTYIEIERDSGRCSEAREKHAMRYFFLPEIELALQTSGFCLLACTEWMSDRPAGHNTWNVVVVAQSIRRMRTRPKDQ